MINRLEDNKVIDANNSWYEVGDSKVRNWEKIEELNPKELDKVIEHGKWVMKQKQDLKKLEHQKKKLCLKIQV